MKPTFLECLPKSTHLGGIAVSGIKSIILGGNRAELVGVLAQVVLVEPSTRRLLV